ncbi:uncharacterized protein [Ptychodera flava]|uniref:uncharacterized protein n=1 Tax=Ptychodera flava TaxID=63121 RepID=UPI00396A1E5B
MDGMTTNKDTSLHSTSPAFTVPHLLQLLANFCKPLAGSPFSEYVRVKDECKKSRPHTEVIRGSKSCLNDTGVVPPAVAGQGSRNDTMKAKIRALNSSSIVVQHVETLTPEQDLVDAVELLRQQYLRSDTVDAITSLRHQYLCSNPCDDVKSDVKTAAKCKADLELKGSRLKDSETYTTSRFETRATCKRDLETALDDKPRNVGHVTRSGPTTLNVTPCKLESSREYAIVKSEPRSTSSVPCCKPSVAGLVPLNLWKGATRKFFVALPELYNKYSPYYVL